uniref:Uncharacterized protein n=1 Tax=Setaria italica TaxID=4555 RepID=K4A4G0_SETIT
MDYTAASPEFIYCCQLLYCKAMTTCLKTHYIACYCSLLCVTLLHAHNGEYKKLISCVMSLSLVK